jgi:predicted AlkP superfamily pyrophosphatase or phosphodiesterase
MKIFSLLIVVCLVCFGCSQQQDQDKHVILISIDGLRPDFYLDEAWPAPHLKRLLAEGAYAQEVHSVAPSLTYPSHTTIVTGAVPMKHGIYHNVPFGNHQSRWYWEESHIKSPTLWDAVRQAGLRSGAVMWPVTVGAPID